MVLSQAELRLNTLKADANKVQFVMPQVEVMSTDLPALLAVEQVASDGPSLRLHSRSHHREATVLKVQSGHFSRWV